MILLTGATGFIGSNLLEKLSKMGRVRCLVRSKEKAEELEKFGYETAIGDMKNRQIPPGMLHGINVVVHAAGLIHGKTKDLREVNVVGTKKLIEVCKRENAE